MDRPSSLKDGSILSLKVQNYYEFIAKLLQNFIENRIRTNLKLFGLKELMGRDSPTVSKLGHLGGISTPLQNQK